MSARFCLTLFVLFLLTLCTAAGQTPKQGTYTLGGVVFGGHNPFADVTVELLAAATGSQLSSTVTPSDGTYSFSVDNGAYDLRAVPPASSGYSTAIVRGIAINGADVTQNMLLMAGEHRLSGTVHDADGAPASGLYVWAVDAEEPAVKRPKYSPNPYNSSAQTGADGRYEMAVSAGAYSISVVSFDAMPGWLQALLSHQISGVGECCPELPPTFFELVGLVPDVSVSGDVVQDVTLPPLATFSGRVVVNGTPVSEAVVCVMSAGLAAPTPPAEGEGEGEGEGTNGANCYFVGRATSDADGSYEFVLASGDYQVGAIIPWGTGQIEAALDLTVIGDTVADVSLDLLYRLSGTAYAFDEMTQVDGLCMGVQTDISDYKQDLPRVYGVWSKTDASGRYEILLPAGTYTMWAGNHRPPNLYMSYPSVCARFWPGLGAMDGETVTELNVPAPDRFWVNGVVQGLVVAADLTHDIVLPPFPMLFGQTIGTDGAPVADASLAAWGQGSPGEGEGEGEGETDDHADIPLGATEVVVDGGPVSGIIETPGDADYFLFSANEGFSYTIETGGTMDTYIYLFDRDGVTLLAEDDQGGVPPLSKIVWDCTVSGTYFVAVVHFNPETGTGSYTLDIRTGSAAAKGAGTYTLLETLSSIGGSVRVPRDWAGKSWTTILRPGKRGVCHSTIEGANQAAGAAGRFLKAGVDVVEWFYLSSATSDPSGYYEMTVLPGDCFLSASVPFGDGLTGAWFEAPTVLEDTAYDVDFSARHVLSGTAYAADETTPVSELWLVANYDGLRRRKSASVGAPAYAQTDASGRYELVLPDGVYNVGAGNFVPMNVAPFAETLYALYGSFDPLRPEQEWGALNIPAPKQLWVGSVLPSFPVVESVTQDVFLPGFVTVSGRAQGSDGSPVANSSIIAAGGLDLYGGEGEGEGEGEPLYLSLAYNASMSDTDGSYEMLLLDGLSLFTIGGPSGAGFAFTAAPAQIDLTGDTLQNIVLNPVEGAAEGEGEGEGETGLDTDGDGLTDRDEIARWGTDANSPDTDGDGMPDGFEALYNLDPRDPSDATLDLDGDGLTNLEEYLRHADPTNALSPQATYFVSALDGADTPGGGTLENPWATVAYALDQVSATVGHRVTLILQPGAYAADILLEPWVTLAGSAEGAVIIEGGVTGAEGCALRGLEIRPSATTSPLLAMNDAMEVRRCAFTGSAARNATGIVVTGTGPGASLVTDCVFTSLSIGIEIFDAIPTIRRCVFTDWAQYAIVFRANGTGKSINADKALGDAADPNTGYNSFEDIDAEFAILNERDETIAMDNNHWGEGVDTPEAAAARVDGPKDIGAVLAKSSVLIAATVQCIVWDAESLARIVNGQVDLACFGTSFAMTHNTDGLYVFASVLPDTYSVTASAPGYQSSTQSNVEIEGAEVVSLLFQLYSESPVADSDGDGLPDAVETNTGVFVDENDTGTDPNNSDSDGDGINDDVEIAYGSDPTDPVDPACVRPAIPTGVSATDGTRATEVRITWTAVEGAGVSYRVYRNSADDFTGAQALAEGLTDTVFDDTTAVAATVTSGGGCGGSTTKYTRYYYWVTAENACGESLPGASDRGYRGKAGKSSGPSGYVVGKLFERTGADGGLTHRAGTGDLLVMLLLAAALLRAKAEAGPDGGTEQLKSQVRSR